MDITTYMTVLCLKKNLLLAITNYNHKLLLLCQPKAYCDLPGVKLDVTIVKFN